MLFHNSQQKTEPGTHKVIDRLCEGSILDGWTQSNGWNSQL